MNQDENEKKVKWMSEEEEEEEEETIPVRSYSDQKRKSLIAFKEIFSTTDEQMREKFVDFDGLDSEIDTEEKSREEIAVNLSKSIEQLSKIRIDLGSFKSKRAVSSTVSIPPITKKKSFSHSREPSIQSLLEITKSSELIKNRERGTTRRSSISFNVGTLGIFSAREIRPRVSENIPVRSMTLDLLIKDQFDEKIANDFADIIEKIIDKLEVIQHTIPASVIDWDESFKSLEECYGDIKSDECALVSEKGEEDNFFGKFGVEKLQRDRTYISNVLKKLMEELRTKNSYDCLKKEIDDIVKISEDQHNLEVHYEIWSEQLQQLSELIEIENVNNQLQIKTALSDIEKISDKIENIINKSAFKLNFVEKWEESRLKQQKLLLEMKEQNLNDKLSEYTKKEKVDEIISGELITFCQYEISLMETQMEDWRNKYNTEIDEFQQEIDEEKGEINNIKNILEDKLKLRDEQQVVINEFEKEQERKIKAEEYWAAIHRAATIIQSAWRGIMVRKQLGRFENLWKVLKKRKKLALKKKKKSTKLKKKKLLKS